MDSGLAGKGVLVTGGAGGIGTAVTRAFAADGARVAVHYRSSRDAAYALAEEVNSLSVEDMVSLVTRYLQSVAPAQRSMY